jgi:hypothetical protein
MRVGLSANYVRIFYQLDTLECQNQRSISQDNKNLKNQMEESDK